MLGRAVDSALTEAWFCGFQEGAFGMWGGGGAGAEKMNAQRLTLGRTGSGCLTEGHQQGQSPSHSPLLCANWEKGAPSRPWVQPSQLYMVAHCQLSRETSLSSPPSDWPVLAWLASPQKALLVQSKRKDGL